MNRSRAGTRGAGGHTRRVKAQDLLDNVLQVKHLLYILEIRPFLGPNARIFWLVVHPQSGDVTAHKVMISDLNLQTTSGFRANSNKVHASVNPNGS